MLPAATRAAALTGWEFVPAARVAAAEIAVVHDGPVWLTAADVRDATTTACLAKHGALSTIERATAGIGDVAAVLLFHLTRCWRAAADTGFAAAAARLRQGAAGAA